MRSKILLLPLISIGSLCFAQTKISFEYDEAGNQRLRGILAEALAGETQDVERSADIIDEAAFWSMVKLYPVPVRDVLTIAWDTNVDSLIDNVTLYQHNGISNVFQRKNIPNLNRTVQVDMGRMYIGVYIVSFQLKDGRVMSRNIIKTP